MIYFRNSDIVYAHSRVCTVPHVLWFDNFSKMFRHTMTTMSRATLADALWTGLAIRQYAFPGISMNIMMRRGFPVTAMPDDPFEHVAPMLATMMQVTEVKGNMPLLYDDSMYVRWGVNRVPVVPMRDKLPPEVLASLQRCPARLDDFYPKGLLKTNVGSNIGLCKVMLEVLRSSGHDLPAPPKKYLAMTVDINIFDRVLKANDTTTLSMTFTTHTPHRQHHTLVFPHIRR